MKRFHAHVHVDDLAQSIAFYSKLFATAPTRVEPDYAKWMGVPPKASGGSSSSAPAQAAPAHQAPAPQRAPVTGKPSWAQ